MHLTFSAYYTLIFAALVLLLGKWLVRHLRLLREFNIPSPWPAAWSWPSPCSCSTRPWAAPSASAASCRWPSCWCFLVHRAERQFRQAARRRPFAAAVPGRGRRLHQPAGSGRREPGQDARARSAVRADRRLRHPDGRPWHGRCLGPGFRARIRHQGAVTLGIACATFGLVIGGLIGGPLAKALITRRRLAVHDPQPPRKTAPLVKAQATAASRTPSRRA